MLGLCLVLGLGLATRNVQLSPKFSELHSSELHGHLCQGGDVSSAFVFLWICLSVSKILWKLLDQFRWNFQNRSEIFCKQLINLWRKWPFKISAANHTLYALLFIATRFFPWSENGSDFSRKHQSTSPTARWQLNFTSFENGITICSRSISHHKEQVCWFVNSLLSLCALMLLVAAVTVNPNWSCLPGFTFLVLAHRVVPDKSREP